MTNQLSFDELASNDVTEYDEVETKAGRVKLGSVSSEDIIEWIEENESEDKNIRRFSSLRLVVKCFINPDGTRIPREGREVAVQKLAKRDARENAKLVDRTLKLNGLRAKDKTETDLKNDSGEATTAASPSASPAS